MVNNEITNCSGKSLSFSLCCSASISIELWIIQMCLCPQLLWLTTNCLFLFIWDHESEQIRDQIWNITWSYYSVYRVGIYVSCIFGFHSYPIPWCHMRIDWLYDITDRKNALSEKYRVKTIETNVHDKILKSYYVMAFNPIEFSLQVSCVEYRNYRFSKS